MVDVETVLRDWLAYYVTDLADPDRYRYSVEHWEKFFLLQRTLGLIPETVTINDLTPELQRRFREHRAAEGVGGHTISRDLAALRGALNWAWKHQRVRRRTHIADVPLNLRGQVRDRVLSIQEIADIVNACAGRPEREHLIRFVVLELGTAGRPQAILELDDTNIDLDRNFINSNRPGKLHSRKRRAIVPIAEAVRPWVIGIKGKVIKYRVPRKCKPEEVGGANYFERPTKSIKTCWNNVCREAGITDATPKTLRHTMLTWLAERGVPTEERQMLAGHAPRGTTARNYEHLSPAYLNRAVKEIDVFFQVLRRHTSVIAGPDGGVPLP